MDCVSCSIHERYVTLLLLQFDGDTAYRSLLDTLHQMCHKPCNLVVEFLTGDDSNFLTYPFVDVEIQGQLGVVLLNDHPCCLLHCLCPDPGRWGGDRPTLIIFRRSVRPEV